MTEITKETVREAFRHFMKDEEASLALWNDITKVMAIHLCYWDEYHKPLKSCYARVDVEREYRYRNR